MIVEQEETSLLHAVTCIITHTFHPHFDNIVTLHKRASIQRDLDLLTDLGQYKAILHTGSVVIGLFSYSGIVNFLGTFQRKICFVWTTTCVYLYIHNSSSAAPLRAAASRSKPLRALQA